jgi:thiamine-phosphate pyrophosphorylase
MLPAFYPIIDTAYLGTVGTDPVEFARLLIGAGVRIAQYRHKGEFTRAQFEEVDLISKLFIEAEVPFIVNDRADIARAVGAAGVHVGQDDLSPVDVRRIIGPGIILGYSTHNADQLAAADSQPVDYLAIGPMFETPSKQNPDSVVGIESLSELRKLTTKPLVAIGGISLGRASEVLSAGADSVAVISGVVEENLAAWVRLHPNR